MNRILLASLRHSGRTTTPAVFRQLPSTTAATTPASPLSYSTQRHWMSSNSDEKGPSNTTSSSNSQSKTDAAASGNSSNTLRSLYVHPLSKHVLEYLQETRHDWVAARHLQNLTLHRDGSLELISQTTPFRLRVWTSYDVQDKKHWLAVGVMQEQQQCHEESESVVVWQERFLLQDNLLPAWHGNRTSVPERIHAAVRDMMQVVEAWESKQSRNDRVKKT